MMKVSPKDFKLKKSKGFKLVEPVDPVKCLWMLKHFTENTDVLLHKGKDQEMPGGQKITHEQYAEYTKNLLRLTVSRRLRGDNGELICESYEPIQMTVDYHPLQHGYGRLWSRRKGEMTLQGVCKMIRHTLAEGALKDIDIVNAFPEIILQYSKAQGFTCKWLETDCKGRDDLIKSVSEFNEGLVGTWRYIGHDNFQKVMDVHGDDVVFECHFIDDDAQECSFSLTKNNIEEGNFSHSMFILPLDVRKETNIYDIQFCKEINLMEIMKFYD